MSGRQLQDSRQWNRGGGRNNNNNNERKSTEFKFATQEQSQKGNYSTFNAVKEKIVIHIKKHMSSEEILRQQSVMGKLLTQQQRNQQEMCIVSRHQQRKQ